MLSERQNLRRDGLNAKLAQRARQTAGQAEVGAAGFWCQFHATRRAGIELADMQRQPRHAIDQRNLRCGSIVPQVSQ